MDNGPEFHWHNGKNGPVVRSHEDGGTFGHEHPGGGRNHYHDSDGVALYPFEPDWCIAPAATLEDWMQENDLDVDTMAFAAGIRTRPGRRYVTTAIQGVLDKKPLTQPVADILWDITGIPAKFWMNYEHNYRAGLAAGLKDVTD